jgi:hypothetical protein
MRFKIALVLFVAGCTSILSAQEKFKLTGTAVPERDSAVVDVDFTGPAPAAGSPYLAAGNWKPRWSSAADSATVLSTVNLVSVDLADRKIQLHLSGNVPSSDEMARRYWTILFNPPDDSTEAPQVISFAPNAALLPSPIAKDCKNPQADKKPYFCPPSPGQTPDLSFTGNFLVAGGTKPIYTFSMKGNLVASTQVWTFYPGISTDIEINQNLQPPNNRTRFDPDSITAGLSFTRIIDIQKWRLYGIDLQLGLPSGEFSRSDPSSNIVVSAMGSFVFNALQSQTHKSLYATLYPLLGFEAGHNLMKPNQINSVPVNFANYNGIFRGLIGADAVVAAASPDRTANVFAITGSYRVRLPALDEPFENSLHQTTIVDLTTKARNWVEADITYAPWSFQYASLIAKYQYGSLPPMFNLVDHKFTLGLTLQAVQSRKPGAAPPLK